MAVLGLVLIVVQRKEHSRDLNECAHGEAGKADLVGPRAILCTRRHINHLFGPSQLTKVEDATGAKGDAEPQPGLQVTGGGRRSRKCQDETRDRWRAEQHQGDQHEQRGRESQMTGATAPRDLSRADVARAGPVVLADGR